MHEPTPSTILLSVLLTQHKYNSPPAVSLIILFTIPQLANKVNEQCQQQGRSLFPSSATFQGQVTVAAVQTPLSCNIFASTTEATTHLDLYSNRGNPLVCGEFQLCSSQLEAHEYPHTLKKLRAQWNSGSTAPAPACGRTTAQWFKRVFLGCALGIKFPVVALIFRQNSKGRQV